VHTTINDADTFFPTIDSKEWKEVSSESFERGEKFEHPFEFVVLERK
jgi:dihydrofolate reductase